MPRKITVASIGLIAGFMLAILIQTKQNPEIRDTRDLWEIRSELRKQQMVQNELYGEITEAEQIIRSYQSESNATKLQTLQESVELLKEKAGMTEVEGEGLVITIEPIFKGTEMGPVYTDIQPSLLTRFINELYTYGATDIAVENERVIQISPIRQVNDYTYVNGRRISSPPIQIKVLAEDPERLLNYMEISPLLDYFAVENLNISFEFSIVNLPEFHVPMDLHWLQPVDDEGVGES
ncbi:DUF881 domain-containing protein [Salirhabdus salicampi]|uniref:DUF881 domain-containing protein n=1 Tax=Salirhabdus salicampi TaxID=476102 RepID=UPI0020C305C1|nr:DUF881 domain-containing protein [Salirhabdus salicampi]MCP8616599.1 DUF881 domain-containing protein [Salirhabdus salicampi]